MIVIIGRQGILVGEQCIALLLQFGLDAVFQRAEYVGVTDLDAAVTQILRQTLEYLKEEGKEIDPQTELTYNSYRNLL